jgi:lysophospholipase L1-like esterase
MALGAVVVSAAILWPWPSHDPNKLRFYAADDQRLQAAHVTPEAVFIGDSLVQFWPGRAPASWRPVWVNRGILGQRSDQVRARFAQDVLALHPHSVLILAGTNDDWGRSGVLPLQATEANIAAMAGAARAAGIRVVLATAPPVSPLLWPPMLGGGERRLEAMNAWIRAYATRSGVACADFWSVMSPALTTDGIHPSAAGYARMSNAARQALSD